MTNHLRSEHVLAWRRVLSVLLALGIGLSSVEIAWGDARVGGDADSVEVAFWATYQGAEIDLILRRGDQLPGVECKRADAPPLTPSMRIALDDLGLERIAVVYPGERRYPIAPQVEAVPLNDPATTGGLFGGDTP